ncbi:MAG: rod shape-determining protein RodA [Lentisphaerae bacterium RIFOXYC12_FULL_60_16]|nr:MAG: rod shape-determining protein RodA [Lentisphaerae bacterium RIFOXYC12_FULL_60_16]OGV83483.1 MAG: rod shape-determining protein RodA [Lentisphaerae bacterium RIFOXYB12_FULL_60_10]
MNRLWQSLALLRRMNWVLNAAVLGLLVIGILFVYSACYVHEDAVRNLYLKQLWWAAGGWICCLVLTVVDYRWIVKWAPVLYVVSVVLLLLVMVVGLKVYGARRWIAVGGFQLQPSEIAKLAVILMVARLFSTTSEGESPWRPFLASAGIALIPMALIMKQPDLGTAMVFVPAVFILWFVAGAPWRALAGVVLAGLLAVGLLVGALFLPGKLGMSPEHQEWFHERTGLSEYQRERILVFFNSDRDPLGAGWNKMQSEIAVGSGGLWGKGFLKGTQNILGYLPRSVAPTDFIYSVIAEESGFMGSMLVLGLFTLLLISGLQTAVHCEDKAGRLICVGVMALLFSHVFVNMAMTVGLMPVTGVPLPLLSYGGSFMMLVMSGVGLVQSVQVRMYRPEWYEKPVPNLSRTPVGRTIARKGR